MSEWLPISEFRPHDRSDEEQLIVSDGEMVWVASFGRYYSETWERTDSHTQKLREQFVDSWSPYPRRARDIKFFMRFPPPPGHDPPTT